MHQLHSHSGLRGKWFNLKVFENQEHYQDFKKYGNVVRPQLWLPNQPNGITDVGIHYNLNSAFRGVAQLSTWYAGLIDNSGFTGVAAGDTMASHSGWTEITTQYDESVRQTLSFPAAASRAISASVSFTMNATKTVQGILVNSENTKGGTSGTLWATAVFGSPPALVSGNVLTGNYTLSD